MSTCLFTGQSLGVDTAREHTIPFKLAGRICSRSVSSAEFNNRCSNPFDESLVESYKPIMQALFPLLDAQHAPGKTELENPDDPGSYAIENGVFVLTKTKILACDIHARRPTIFCGDPDDVSRMNEQLGLADSEVSQTWVAPAERSGGLRTTTPICPELEIAALKCALLTFDAVLEKDQRRFSRSARLDAVRQFVKSAVETGKWDCQVMRKFSLGFQYEKLATINQVRQQLISQAAKKSEFEHILIASGNMGMRTLDIVWLIAGTDPFGFRVSENWDEGDFTCTIINEMLKGGVVHGPFWGNLPTSICANTMYGPEVEQIFRQARHHRLHMHRQAELRVENSCDEWVVSGLVNEGRFNSTGGHTIATAIRARLEKTLHRALEDAGIRKQFDRLLGKCLSELPKEIRDAALRTEADAKKIDWPSVLSTYRKALSELERDVGFCNDMHTGEISFEVLPRTFSIDS